MLERLTNETGARFHYISNPTDLTVENLIKLNPRYIFFPHWSHIIHAEIFQKYECIIFHMTDLPYGRGGSPLQNLIARGIYETKISALQCASELDAGPVYMKRPLSLHGAAEEIYLRTSNIIEEMIVEIIKNPPNSTEQTGSPTYFKRRKPEEGNLLNSKTLEQAFDMIRMLDADGYPHAFINVGNFRLEFTRASRNADSIVTDVKITMQGKNMESNT